MQERGGIVVGSPHSEGGVPFVLQDTGTHIEEEGGEINIPVELALSPQIYTLKGTNAEILQQILKKANLSISDKVTTVKSGDIVICVKSAWDNEVREITGTIAQILSAINTSRGCKLIEPGAKVVSENGIEKKHSGGAVADKKILPFHERMRLLQEHPKEFVQVLLGKGGGIAFQETKGQKVSKQQDVQIINSNSPRWQKKKNGITALSNNIHRLRSKVTRDLNGDEKEFLTALIIMMMDKTGERIGNDDSARNGHYGISGLRKKHISVIGDKVHLSYTGKSGVLHEKSFSDERIARALKKAIKNSPNRFVFSTTAGFIIKADKVNRYLQDFDITAKDIRGYNANKWIVEKLQASDIPKEEKERKRKFIGITKKVAEKIGHTRFTLTKHYMVPELPQEYIVNGKIIDLKELGYYKEGGDV